MHEIREHMPGTTVAHKLNQGTIPPLGGFKRRVAFLAKQKGTKENGISL